MQPSAPQQSSRLVPLRWLWIPVLIAVALVALDVFTDLDRELVRPWYDGASRDFPLRMQFWFDVVMHHWTKYIVATVGCLTGAALLLTFVMPALRLDRRILLFLVLAIGLAPLAVTVAKAVSARHCPWDVDEFGGYVPYEKLFDEAPKGSRPGHCFPAGHASTGFALMAFYFAAHRRRRRYAAPFALAGGIAAGLVLGYGRVLQGAHFPSHVAWSGLLCWVVMVALYAAVFRNPASQAREDTPARSTGWR